MHRNCEVHSACISLKTLEGMVFNMHLIFYTQPDCALCEEAKMMMELAQEDHPLTWEEVNIRDDEELHEKYMLRVPVLEQNGTVVLEGTIGYVDLVELFEEL